MSKRYGMQIGDVGIEFPSREDRDKAILTFTRGSTVKIHNYAGPRYGDGKDSFSTYERDNSVDEANCAKCSGVFTTETCCQRTVPAKKSYPDKGFAKDKTEDKFLCDACYAKVVEEKRVYDAKQTLESAGEDF